MMETPLLPVVMAALLAMVMVMVMVLLVTVVSLVTLVVFIMMMLVMMTMLAMMVFVMAVLMMTAFLVIAALLLMVSVMVSVLVMLAFIMMVIVEVMVLVEVILVIFLVVAVSFRLCRDVYDGHVCLLYGDVHVRDDGRDDRVHRGVSCGRRHVRDGVRGDDVFRGHRGRLCGDDDVLYVLCVPFLRVRGDGVHGVPCRLRTRGGGPCSLRGPGLGSGLSPDPRPPPDIPVLQLQPTSLLVEFVL